MDAVIRTAMITLDDETSYTSDAYGVHVRIPIRNESMHPLVRPLRTLLEMNIADLGMTMCMDRSHVMFSVAADHSHGKSARELRDGVEKTLHRWDSIENTTITSYN